MRLTKEDIERAAKAIYLSNTPESARWELVDERFRETVWRAKARACAKAWALEIDDGE